MIFKKKSWIAHRKEFSKKKMKYNEALKNAQFKSEYHKSKD
jgi:hypothetical protein